MALFEPPSSREDDIVGSDAATRALSVTAVENEVVSRGYENIAWVRSEATEWPFSSHRVRGKTTSSAPTPPPGRCRSRRLKTSSYRASTRTLPGSDLRQLNGPFRATEFAGRRHRRLRRRHPGVVGHGG